MYPRFSKLAVLAATISALSACGVERNFNQIEDRPTSSAPAGSGTLGLGKGAIHSKDGWLHNIDYSVAYNVPEEVVDGIKLAAKAWNDALGKNLVNYKGRLEKARSETPVSLYGSLDDDETVFYFDENWVANTGKSTSTLATTVWENSPSNANAVVKGDVRFNAQSFKFVDTLADRPDSTSTLDAVDIQSVMLHEIGHLIGLDHVAYDEDPDSVMHAQTPIGYGFAFRELSEKDKDRAASIYKK